MFSAIGTEFSRWNHVALLSPVHVAAYRFPPRKLARLSTTGRLSGFADGMPTRHRLLIDEVATRAELARVGADTGVDHPHVLDAAFVQPRVQPLGVGKLRLVEREDPKLIHVVDVHPDHVARNVPLPKPL